MHNGSDKGRAKDAIASLVREFDRGKTAFKDPHKYDEAKVRAGFIDPFFEALGWQIRGAQRKVGRDREVVVEDRAGTGSRRRPDYGFYLGGELKFYVEAKQPSLEISTDLDAAYQLKSYVWSQRAPLGLLTDFEELLTFHGAYKPHREKPKVGRVEALCLTYDRYLDQYDLLQDTLSREAVAGGSVERLLAQSLAVTSRQRGQLERDLFKARGAKPVDVDFLESLTQWREAIARELARRNKFKDGGELTEVVQRFLDRLIFARVAEDRGIERELTVQSARKRWEQSGKTGTLYAYLIDVFRRLEPQFNGGLFRPHPLSDKAKFSDDQILVQIIKSLYFPESPYRFDAMPVEMLGAVYEQFLGSIVRVTEGGQRAKVEPKPEVRHAGGVYYTPRFIVDTIVERTIGPLLEGASPKDAIKLRILDPACGSGSFLMGAFQFLIDWHLRFFVKDPDPAKRYPKACFVDDGGNLRLTLHKKRELLTTCIYGVDIDPQAIEVAQMSLYMKLLEEEAEETLALQRSLELFKAAKYLPDLSNNIRFGNSLLDNSHFEPGFGWTDDLAQRIKPFDWFADETGFGAIMRLPSEAGRGGFDAIIGNPPYIRVQSLSQWAPLEVELYKKHYRSASEGNYDIYVVFIERSLDLLRDGGRLGFIIPVKWWQASYGAKLRILIRRGRHYLRVMDFAHEQVFDDPTTYTCISIFTKSPTPAIAYQRMSPVDLKVSGMNARPRWEHEVDWKTLTDGPWYLGVRAELRPLFDRLRNQAPFLGDPGICLRVFQGLKTSLDPVYVLNLVEGRGQLVKCFSKSLNQEVELENAQLRPLVKGRELKRFAPLPHRKVILFPYEFHDGEASLISSKELQARTPRTWEYLVRNRKALDERERGRFRGSEWYQYGRSQALDVVGLPKLLTPDLTDRMSFSCDKTGELFILGGAAGGYGLLPAKPELAAPLLAILNSSLIEWLLRPPGLSSPFRGGWFSCEARFINLLPIQFPASSADLRILSDLAIDAMDAYSRLHGSRTDQARVLINRRRESVESEIDDRIFSLYGLTREERKAVKEAVAEGRRSIEGTAVDGAEEPDED